MPTLAATFSVLRAIINRAKMAIDDDSGIYPKHNGIRLIAAFDQTLSTLLSNEVMPHEYKEIRDQMSMIHNDSENPPIFRLLAARCTLNSIEHQLARNTMPKHDTMTLVSESIISAELIIDFNITLSPLVAKIKTAALYWLYDIFSLENTTAKAYEKTHLWLQKIFNSAAVNYSEVSSSYLLLCAIMIKAIKPEWTLETPQFKNTILVLRKLIRYHSHVPDYHKSWTINSKTHAKRWNSDEYHDAEQTVVELACILAMLYANTPAKPGFEPDFMKAATWVMFAQSSIKYGSQANVQKVMSIDGVKAAKACFINQFEPFTLGPKVKFKQPLQESTHHSPGISVGTMVNSAFGRATNTAKRLKNR